MRWPPVRSRGIMAASVGSADITTRWPAFSTSGSIFCAALPMSQWPSFEIPMGTASYLSESRPRITEAADASETSCSPLLPPNKTPTRNLFFSGVTKDIFPEKQLRPKGGSASCFQDEIPGRLGGLGFVLEIEAEL